MTTSSSVGLSPHQFRGIVGAACALFTLCALTAACGNQKGAAEAPRDARIELVHSYLDAFNHHSAEQLAGLVTEDVEVYYVEDGGGSSVGTKGRANLRSEMESYFQQLPDVASQIASEIAISGPFVSYSERVRWTRNGEPNVQSSMAVLQFEGDLIERVWYYPAHR